ncbi:MAG TPA: hypothetical protein VJB57_04555 [Dehalococcoidia bacterium]|nr:hypothetical protein [Dehalococcoidia bacterium]
MTTEEITLALVALTLGVAAVGVWYARRGALAAEEENRVVNRELATQHERASPNVEVAIIRTFHVSTDNDGTTVGIEIHILNRSTEPDMVERMSVECEGLEFNWPPAHPSLRQTNRQSPQRPFALVSGEPQESSYAFGPVFKLPLSDLDAELVVKSRDAGESRTSFTFKRN